VNVEAAKLSAARPKADVFSCQQRKVDGKKQGRGLEHCVNLILPFLPRSLFFSREVELLPGLANRLTRSLGL